jgi:Ca2+-binding RTX toxin-like protein
MYRSLMLTAAVAALALPGTAVASTVSADPSTGLLTFTSGNQASAASIVNGSSPGPMRFADALQTLNAGTGCTAGTPVTCPAANLSVLFGNGNDSFDGFSFRDIDITAGAGDDTVNASGSRTQVWGGNGGDTLTVGSNGTARAWGDAGHDHLLGNNIKTELFGGDGVDLVVGNTTNDLLEGGNQDDQLFSSRSVAGTANGGPGDDVIVTLANLPAFLGTFTSNGGTGADVIKGGRFVDVANGEGGADIIDVTGDPANHDTVTCGSGYDTVYADPNDSVAADCENLEEGSLPYNQLYERAVDHLIETFPQITPPAAPTPSAPATN